MAKTVKAAKRPPIKISEIDADSISALALSAEERLPQVAALLLAEIDRAKMLSPAAMPDNVVTMMSTVEFIDERNGQPRTVQLVYPQEADIAQNKISILTPIGAALIGLQEGQTIEWPDRGGATRNLRVINVSQKPH